MEAWRLTRQEFFKSRLEITDRTPEEDPKGLLVNTVARNRKHLASLHQVAVIDAIAKGATIPVSVQMEYPGIFTQYSDGS